MFQNRQGFRRSTETARIKPEGVYRIFVMGGSTAYGLQSMSRYGQEKYSVIRNDETIDYYLERYLGERVGRDHVEVINAAITSHYSHHHLIYLNQVILKYSPDMIVFIDGFNDYYAYQHGFDQFRDYAYQERAHQMLDEPSVRCLARVHRLVAVPQEPHGARGGQDTVACLAAATPRRQDAGAHRRGRRRSKTFA